MSVDLSTSYLGLKLANPVMASSSPLTGSIDTLKQLEEAGVSAVVLPSLFEEQIEHEAMEAHRLVEYGAESFAEALGGYFPELDSYNTGPQLYLDQISSAKEGLSVPVIASLNGTTRGGWVRYAKRMEDAGADALELNVYLIPTDPYATSLDVERRYLDLLAAVVESVDIPVAIKIGPYFSSLAHVAREFVQAGAAGLVLFNRFYQPDIELEDLRVVPNIELSTSAELRLPLRWLAILYGKLRSDLAVTGGAHTSDDVLKSLLVGADAVMMASALLQEGPYHAAEVIGGVTAWLEEHEYDSVEQMKGSMSMASAPNPDGFIRSNYMRVLASYTSPVP
jgi:dihydroorotate dehydrogenase (fumarate)